jgi:hypothetical protein
LPFLPRGTLHTPTRRARALWALRPSLPPLLLLSFSPLKGRGLPPRRESAFNRLFVPPFNAWWNWSPPAATLLDWMGATAWWVGKTATMRACLPLSSLETPASLLVEVAGQWRRVGSTTPLPWVNAIRIPFAEDSSSQSAGEGDSCSWVMEALASDEEMSIGAGGEAEDAAMLLSSPFNLSGGGGGSGAIGEAGDADVSSPPNLLANRGGAICDGICPGSHNVSLLSHLISLHFTGDWLAYLQFAHWADAQLMLYPNVLVHLNSWLSLKSDPAGGVTAPE